MHAGGQQISRRASYRVQSLLTPIRLPNGCVKPCRRYLESCPRTAPFGKAALWTLM
jgi:hypothetical protein